MSNPRDKLILLFLRQIQRKCFSSDSNQLVNHIFHKINLDGQHYGLSMPTTIVGLRFSGELPDWKEKKYVPVR